MALQKSKMTYEKKTMEMLKKRMLDQKFIENAEREMSEMEDRLVILKQRSHILGLENLSKMERNEWAYHYELLYRTKLVKDRLTLIDQGLSVLSEDEKGLLLARVDGGSQGLSDYAERVLDLERSTAYRKVNVALEKVTRSIFGLSGSCD